MSVFSLFFNKKQQLLGVDIGSAQVKIVELVRNSQGLFLQAYAIEPMPAGLVIDRTITDAEAVGQIITTALNKTKFISKRAATAVVGSVVMTKVIELHSSLNDIEREAQICLEAEKHIPYPLSEVNFDFDVIARSSQNPNYDKVLLAVSLTENVELRADALIFAGLEAKVVDIECYAMQRALSLVMSDGIDALDDNIVMIDIGHRQFTVYVFKNKEIIYNKEQAADLSFSDVNTSDNEVLAKKLIEAINHALSFYLSTQTNHLTKNGIKNLFLCGGLKPTIMQYVQHALSQSLVASNIAVDNHININIANPFHNMGISTFINPTQLKQDAPSLMLACGLAMRSFD
ncbi:MAG: hypothetical protein CSA42_04120 [Gammaproteobacteria bacterium]|nr:MAG: hypothetical protein CSA42_04120 [Gammaproteobacteria bacterium]